MCTSNCCTTFSSAENRTKNSHITSITFQFCAHFCYTLSNWWKCAMKNYKFFMVLLPQHSQQWIYAAILDFNNVLVKVNFFSFSERDSIFPRYHMIALPANKYEAFVNLAESQFSLCLFFVHLARKNKTQ